jgi:hypothetical protein
MRTPVPFTANPQSKSPSEFPSLSEPEFPSPTTLSEVPCLDPVVMYTRFDFLDAKFDDSPRLTVMSVCPAFEPCRCFSDAGRRRKGGPRGVGLIVSVAELEAAELLVGS